MENSGLFKFCFAIAAIWQHWWAYRASHNSGLFILRYAIAPLFDNTAENQIKSGIQIWNTNLVVKPHPLYQQVVTFMQILKQKSQHLDEHNPHLPTHPHHPKKKSYAYKATAEFE